MADEWYYVRQGEEYGPVSAGRLKQLASSGQLQPTDLVWKIGMDKKVPARTVKGLFGNGSSADSRIPPPPGKSAARSKEDIAPVDPMDEDEEMEDRPRKKAKKKGVPVWVWLLLGGGFFFCCCVGVPVGGYFGFRSWFGGVESALEKQKQIKSGMTLKQVEGILGPGKVIKEGKIGGQTTKTVK